MAATLGQKCTRIVSAAFRTFVVAYLLFALVSRLSVLGPEILKECNEDCTFIRFWGTPDLPRSAEKFLPGDDAGDSGLPVFMTVRNGEKRIRAGTPDPYQAIQIFYSNLALTLSKITHTEDIIKTLTRTPITNEETFRYRVAICPGRTAEEMQAICARDDTKNKVINHLRESAMLKIYLFSIPVWAILDIAHDTAIISESIPEIVSLILGYSAVVPQVLAFASGLLWATGAVEVFFAPLSESCGCYYELEVIPMLVLIMLPVGIYMVTRTKLWRLGYATLHGDYLFSTSYNIPYRAAAVFNADPTYGFMNIPDATGEREYAESGPRKRGLTVQQFKRPLKGLYDSLGWFFSFFSLYSFYAFALPTLTVRFYDVVVVNFVKDGKQYENYGAAVLGVFLLLAPCYVGYKQYQRLRVLYELCKNEKERLNALRDPDNQDAVHFANYSYSAPCISKSIRGPVLALEACLMIIFSCLSLRLVGILWRGDAVAADNAGIVGSGGFYLFTAVLNSWVPSDTTFRAISEAIGIKGGSVPAGGLAEIEELHKWKPRLGLHAEAQCVKQFTDKHGDLPIRKYGLGLPKEDEKQWLDFLTEFIDDESQTTSCSGSSSS